MEDVADDSAEREIQNVSRKAQIQYGTSNALLVTEAAGRPQFWTRRGRGPDFSDPGGGNHVVMCGYVFGTGWADPRNSIPFHIFSIDGLQDPGPCGINCTDNNEAFSFHPNGVNGLFADGRVRFLQKSIAVHTYAALVTRAGGEVVAGDCR